MTAQSPSPQQVQFALNIDGERFEFTGCELGRGGSGCAFYVEPSRKHVIKAFVSPDPPGNDPSEQAQRVQELAAARIKRDHELGMMQKVRGRWTPDAAGVEVSPVGPAILMRRYQESLQGHVIAQGPVSAETGAGIYARLLLAVRQSAEKCGVSHCDVKPDNILLSTNSKGDLDVTLADWGGAKLIGEERTCATFIFAPPEVLVTERKLVPHYNTDGSVEHFPKDVRSLGGAVSAKQDVYSSAATIAAVTDKNGPPLGLFPCPGAVMSEWARLNGSTGHHHLDLALLHATDKDVHLRSSPTDALLDIACIREARVFLAQEPEVVSDITNRYVERGEHLRSPSHEAAIGYGVLRLLPEDDPCRAAVKAKQESCERAAHELSAMRAQLAKAQAHEQGTKATRDDATTTKQPKLTTPRTFADRQVRDRELAQAMRANQRTQNNEPARGPSR